MPWQDELVEGDVRASPLFFFSYGRPKPVLRTTRTTLNSQLYAATFFEDLSDLLSELVATQAGETPGYMDTRTETGHHWPGELLDALAQCQVLLALISPRYVRSPWCADEREIFARRMISPRRTGVSRHGANILPVRWLPLENERDEPADLHSLTRLSLQLPDAEVSRVYEQRGIAGLLQNRQDYEPIYNEVVWKVAMTIRDACAAYWVHPDAVRLSAADAGNAQERDG